MAATITNVHFILDKSGSMTTVQNATISGFNEYIESLKGEFKFTLTLFNHEITKTPTKDLKDVKKLDKESYSPTGMTALYDAVCQTLNDVKDTKGKNLVVIMTDGQENSSQEYTEKDMQKLIKELEGTGKWTFVYLGANQDSWETAQKFGLAKGNVANFNASSVGTRAVFTTMSANTSAYASMDSANTSTYFSAADKEDLENAK